MLAYNQNIQLLFVGIVFCNVSEPLRRKWKTLFKDQREISAYTVWDHHAKYSPFSITRTKYWKQRNELEVIQIRKERKQ